eukprot:2134068-Ditylum_brightwellii.AAC.1
MTPAELEILKITYQQQLNTYQTYNNTDKALMNQILATVSNKSIPKAMNQPYTLLLHIEDLFEQINVAQDLATANGTEYSKAQL